MNKILLTLAAMLLITFSGAAQKPTPQGASRFITELGGLALLPPKVDILRQIAGTKIYKVESGGGAADWTELDGRVFLRATWMVEIGDKASNYGVFDLEQGLAAELRSRLVSEGFRVTPKKVDFHYMRYQKGSTVGTLEVRSCFLNSGNLPLRIEFIFNESYRRTTKRRQ